MRVNTLFHLRIQVYSYLNTIHSIKVVSFQVNVIFYFLLGLIYVNINYFLKDFHLIQFLFNLNSNQESPKLNIFIYYLYSLINFYIDIIVLKILNFLNLSLN